MAPLLVAAIRAFAKGTIKAAEVGIDAKGAGLAKREVVRAAVKAFALTSIGMAVKPGEPPQPEPSDAELLAIQESVVQEGKEQGWLNAAKAESVNSGIYMVIGGRVQRLSIE